MPPQVYDVTLAIDIGSTETRQVYVWRDEHGEIHRQVVENRRDHHVNISYTGFSSRILVHDEQDKRYIGNLTQIGKDSREESSAKYAPYALVGKMEEFMDQYPLLQRLRDEQARVGKDVLHPRLEKAFDQLLGFVFDVTKRNLSTLWAPDKVEMRIKTLVLTIPSQWNREFEALYRRLFLGAFQSVFADRPRPAVQFVTEADALANYTLHEALSHHRLGLGLPTMDEILSKTNAQCFIDCGGHNANSTLTSFNRKSDGSGAMCLLTRPQGAGGGSEMVYHDLMEQAIALYRIKKEDQTPLPGWFRHDLKQQATRAIREFARWTVFDLHPPQPAHPEPVTDEMRKKAFESGFKHVKDMVKRQLQELARIKSEWDTPADQQIASIIVSGGSSLHPDFYEWIEKTCKDLDLDAPHFTLNMELNFGPVRIATGAAYASLTAQSIDSFAQNCAFGIQKGNVMRDTNDLDKDETAVTIWHNKQKVKVTLVATGNLAEYRITCQPFLNTFTERLETDRTGARGSSFDFLEIGCLPDFNKYEVEFDLNTRAKQVEIKLHQIPASTRRNASRISGTIILGPFPVYIEVGSGNLLIDLDHDELNRQIQESFRPFWLYTYRDNDDEDLPDAPPDGNDDDGPPDNQHPPDNEGPADFEDSADVEDRVNDEDPDDADYRPNDAGVPRGSGRHDADDSSIGSANYDGGRDLPQVPRAPAGSAANDPAGRKRPAPSASDDSRPQKRAQTSRGVPSSTNDTPRQNVSRPIATPAEQIWRGTASGGRERSSAPSPSPTPPANRDNGGALRQSTDTPSTDLRAPTRRTPAAPADPAAGAFPFSDRRRENGTGVPAGYLARRNPRNNIILGRNNPTPTNEPPLASRVENGPGIRNHTGRLFSPLSSVVPPERTLAVRGGAASGANDRTPARGGSSTASGGAVPTSSAPEAAQGRAASGPSRGPLNGAEFFARREAGRLAYQRGGRGGGGGGRGGSSASQRSSEPPQPASTSGTAEGSRGQPRGFSGFRPANRGRGPRTSD